MIAKTRSLKCMVVVKLLRVRKTGLEKLIEIHTEHEKIYELEAGMTPAIIGKGGGNIQKIQKESGTYVNIVRAKEREDDGDNDQVVIRGTTSALQKADTMMNDFIALFKKENQTLKFPPALTSLIVGKRCNCHEDTDRK